LVITYVLGAEGERDLINQSITGYNRQGQYPSLYIQRILDGKKLTCLNFDQKQT